MAHSTARSGAGRLGNRKGDRLQPRTLGGADPLSRGWRSTDRQQPCGEPNPPGGTWRKNWLFAGSQRAGERAANVMSLIQSAKLNGHDPYRYLKDVLERLPTQPASRLRDLLPHQWLGAPPDA